jgi:hypothetical protein
MKAIILLVLMSLISSCSRTVVIVKEVEVEPQYTIINADPESEVVRTYYYREID